MAVVELLTQHERYTCGFCEQEISNRSGHMYVAIVGDGEEWHTDCATNAGFELDEPDHDPEFDHDPDMDGELEEEEA